MLPRSSPGQSAGASDAVIMCSGSRAVAAWGGGGREKLVTASATTPHSRSGAVFLYFTPLTLLVFLVLPNGFLLDIATSFILKNQIRASPEQVANFRLLTAVPVYLAFFFGLARDLWNPFGLRDRGLFIIFGTLTAVIFLLMTGLPLSYGGLLLSMVA